VISATAFMRMISSGISGQVKCRIISCEPPITSTQRFPEPRRAFFLAALTARETTPVYSSPPSSRMSAPNVAEPDPLILPAELIRVILTHSSQTSILAATVRLAKAFVLLKFDFYITPVLPRFADGEYIIL
jgi:hypothetical protein